MEFKEIENKRLTRSYEFSLTKTNLDKKVDQKLEIARVNFQMKGFRKGRTPLNVMKTMFGNSTKGEVIQELIDNGIRGHLEKSGHKPASQPSVNLKSGNIDGNDDLVFLFKYEILPNIPKLDYKKITLNEYRVKIDQTAVNKALEELAKTAGSFNPKPKNTKAKEGDQLIIDFTGFIGNKEFKGGTAEDYPLVIGSNSFIPGFEGQLVGCKAGEEVTVKVKFPDDYGNKDLASKDASFKCKIKTLNGSLPAKINDDLAKKFSAKDLNELKKNIKERLANEYSTFSKSLMKKELMDALEKHVKFDLPQSLVDSELSQIVKASPDLESKKEKSNNKKKLNPSADHQKLAKRRVALGLFFAEEGNRNNIEVSEKEYKNAVMLEASKYPGKEKDFFKFLDDNIGAREQIRAPIFEEKVFDFIINLIKPNEKDISFDQFMKKFDKKINNYQ